MKGTNYAPSKTVDRRFALFFRTFLFAAFDQFAPYEFRSDPASRLINAFLAALGLQPRL